MRLFAVGSYFEKHRWPLSALAVLGSGLLVSTLAAALVFENADALRRADAGRRVATYASVVQGFIDLKTQQLRSARTQLAESATLDRAEFSRLHREMAQDFDGLRALAWLPRVTETEPDLSSRFGPSDSTDFRIFALSPEGRPRFDSGHHERFPVYFVEPLAANRSMVGFDLAADKLRSDTLRLAMATGSIRLTPGLALRGPADNGVTGVLAFAPVFRHSQTSGNGIAPAAAAGALLAIYPVGELIESALRLLQPAAGFDIYVVESEPGESERLLYVHDSRLRSGQAALPLSGTSWRSGWHYEANLRFVNRTWTLIYRPVEAMYPREKLSAALTFLAGVALTFLLALYLRSTLTQRDRITRLVAERTLQLSEANARLHEKIVRLGETEETLREMQSRQRDFAEAASDWFWELDRHFNFRWVSPRFFDVTGFDRSTFVGRPLWAVAGIDPDQDGHWLRHRQTLEAHYPFRDFECILTTPRGATLHLRFSGRPIKGKTGTFVGYLGTATDVTPQVRMQRRAERDSRFLSQAMDSVPDGIALFDAEDRLVYCNDWYRQICAPIGDAIIPGVSFEAILRVALERGFIEDATPDDEEWIQQRLAIHRNPSTSIEFRRGGRILKIRENRVPDGSIFQVLIDITDVRRQEERLRQSQKMEAVGTLAGGIAHDFNNILSIIRGYTDLARTQAGPEVPLQQTLSSVVRSVERAAAVTKGLLAFSRKKAPETRLVDLYQLVIDQNFLLEPLLRPKVLLTTQCGAGSHSVRADPDLIAQALMNLVINARDAMPDGGALSIAVDIVEPDSGELPSDVSCPFVRLSVTDTGIGMSRETRARLFEPFYTTKAPGEGTGLGLAMVYSIVDQAGGHIHVDSEVNRGTTFHLYFPHVAGPWAAEGTDALPSIAGRSASGLTVLLAEDEPELRTLLRDTLSAWGYTVLAAADGVEALALYEDHAVDIVVTDIVMPEMDGVRVVQLLRELDPHLPVVFMTGHPGRGAEFTAEFPPDTSVLSKPFAPDRLRAVLASLPLGGNARHSLPVEPA